jgi:hypothetical protein
MILPNDHVVPNPEPNQVDDHNGEAISHPDLAANPDVDANPESDSNSQVYVEEDNAEIDGDDVEEDNPDLAANPDGVDDD